MCGDDDGDDNYMLLLMVVVVLSLSTVWCAHKSHPRTHIFELRPYLVIEAR